MLIRLSSARCLGIDASPVIVEVNVSNGIGLHLVGLADAAVKESLLRITTALQTLGLKVPGKKIVINLAPADEHKRGSGYDLPIALGIIAASEQLDMPDLGRYVMLGELGLDGTIRPVPGALPITEMALKSGYNGCILPYESALETLDFCRDRVYGVHNLTDVLSIVSRQGDYAGLLLSGEQTPEICQKEKEEDGLFMDFADIMGQESAKRGLEIAAAAGHSVIMIGPPGSGKSSLAKAMRGILPPMTLEESLQTSKIYSVAGLGKSSGGLMRQRPFRAPHCTASASALTGGGSSSILPGEVSLAHNGILFLDELCEIPRKNVEILRAPLEDKRIVISRLKNRIEYPSDFTLVAATNPCPCGYYGEGDRCTCSVGARKAYLAKLSGPLMDRIDLQLWLSPVDARSLVYKKKAESSAEVAARVAAVREIQRKRFDGEGIFCNAQMTAKMLDIYCPLTEECRDFLQKAMDRMGLSARACTRIIKLSRTIADMAGSTDITVEHLAEAVSYRFLDKRDLF